MTNALRSVAMAALLLMMLAPMPTASADNPKCVGDETGFGGQAIACQRACDDNSVLTVEVFSHDSSSGGYASVSGQFDCGGAVASCAEKKECNGKSPGFTSRSDSAGACTAFSDETWNSKLEVKCSSNIAETPPPPPPWCPVIRPIEVCVDLIPPIVPPETIEPPEDPVPSPDPIEPPEDPVPTPDPIHPPNPKDRLPSDLIEVPPTPCKEQPPSGGDVTIANINPCGLTDLKDTVTYMAWDPQAGTLSGFQCTGTHCVPIVPTLEDNVLSYTW